MASNPKICFDRILPRDLHRPQHTMSIDGRSRAIIVARKLWVNGSTLHVRFLGGTPEEQAIAREQAQWWVEHANLKFEFDNAPDAEIRISFDTNDGAWSFVGTDCVSIPQNEATMNLGFLDGGTAAHEFGHAIGLGHEHQNPAGGIQWNEAVVIRALGGPPNFWTPEQVRHNVLNKYSADQIKGTQFDPHSIMLYAFPGSWTRSGQGTNSNEVLSELDKGFIASAKAYPRAASPQPIELAVGDSASAEIGEPGEEDLFKFEAPADSRYVIETDGHTDVVMKLFGPGNLTSLIAEDDDGGAGLNSRIVADLIPGDYFVQIRHFNTAGGTGSYGVKVTQ